MQQRRCGVRVERCYLTKTKNPKKTQLMTQHNALLRSLLAVAALTAGNAVAGTTATPPPSPPPDAAASESTFDKIWGLATLYKNDSNHFLEEIDLVGRYQGQYYN